jgi:import inner membrane translocase subunit TIM10
MSSLFGGGGRSAGPAGQPDQARLAEAAMELEAVSDLFTRIVSSCHAKCISTRYAEPELNKGESVCVDRCAFLPPLFLSFAPLTSFSLFSCVAKYFSVNEKVQERLQSAQAAGGRVGM